MKEQETSFVKTKKLFGMKHWKGIALILGVYDAISVTVAYFIALWLRFDCRYSLIPEDYYLN